MFKPYLPVLCFMDVDSVVNMKGIMVTKRKILLMAFLGLLWIETGCHGTAPALHRIDLVPPVQPVQTIEVGQAVSNPQGHTITVTSRSLMRDGQPWLPVMGEFHFSRYPEDEWRDELLKMKAGGIDIMASYVFWIHHEEVEGQFDWSGRRNVRRFVQLCHEVGLPIFVRIGPWCHGEVRHGGFPDWLKEKSWRLRSDDPDYLAKVQRLYGQIAEQLQGLLWKDGGPVIGIQLENEYRGRGEHLMTLKKIARQAGLDVPIYTRTGWPKLAAPVPFGQIVPLYGQYPDGFWDRSTSEMPGDYWKAFNFDLVRMDVAIANEQLGSRPAEDDAAALQYPYLTCELGGGMMPSYHRRIHIAPMDIAALFLTKLGSGSNLPGYYMYHGGTNPEGKRTTLHENQRIGGYNDLPVNTYDFQAPLGEFGQVREHYHLLRRLHLFLRDFGSSLTAMPTTLPADRPSEKEDADTLRWAVRSDGQSGYLFVNNYQRLMDMPPKANVQFALKRDQNSLTIPQKPLTIPAEASFFWPFNMDLAGARLVYATAQPICTIEHENAVYFVFAETTGIDPEFVFDAAGVKVMSATGRTRSKEGRFSITHLKSGHDAAISLLPASGRPIIIILLNEQDSLACWKGQWAGRERIFLSRPNLLFDGQNLRLCSQSTDNFSLSVLPAPETVTVNGSILNAESDGLFHRFSMGAPKASPVSVAVKQVKEAGPAGEVQKGSANVAESPSEQQWESAAVWQFTFPEAIDEAADYLLQIAYTGDIARVYCDDVLLTDNFYNGGVFEVGLKRYGPEVYRKGVTLKILPPDKDAPIYFPEQARTSIESAQKLPLLNAVELIQLNEVCVAAE